MHEVSIALSLLDIAEQHCKKEGYKGIESIVVKIGKASGVMPEALLFAFDAVKHGTLAENAHLKIKEIPVSGYCNSCKNSFSVEETFILCCPKCGDTSFRLDSGRELDVVELDVF
jgi:hydrogenase nickel incorporation protein HypA/HybF